MIFNTFRQIKKSSLVIIYFFIASLAFSNTEAQIKPNKEIKGVYRLINENLDGYEICIVDGPLVRQKIYPEFVYGGNEQRYLFNPRHEIWIDNSISVEEYRYTVAHELNERHLMAKFGYSYADAHDSSLRLERKLRLSDLNDAIVHEAELPKVAPCDCDSVKEIPELRDSIKLKGIYLQTYAVREGITIWIVNGSVVRRDVFPDFGFSGNDLSYYFIPKNEIWIDAQISCEETEFSIKCELNERQYMASGEDYDTAYEKAIKEVNKLREQKYKEAMNKCPIKIQKLKERDIGTGDEK
ncbi:MAG: hypothetical protein P4L35_17855 [Ignavibacteriaceae bacterium]|nr:hypothetical protein [Ignavibacteriaceae bacterium]